MNICVFCSANDLDEKYTKPAIELSELLAKAGHDLVWGGSDYGLMKIMADGVQAGGGRLTGVSVELLKKYARKNADEMIIARDWGKRKMTMLERSNAIVMLVGGLGTLDEVTDILELKKQNLHNKPIIVLNTDGFYDGLRIQLERIESEGFLPSGGHYGVQFIPLIDLIRFVDTPNEVVELINQG